MSERGLVIVGSGPAGVSAAEAFREHDDSTPVRLYTADPDAPYERPPLSKDYLRGDDSDIGIHPRQWYEERDIEVVHRARVERIDVEGRRIDVAAERPQTLGYSALVLACGASPAPLPADGDGTVLYLRSLSDARRLRVAAADADSAVVIGGGFIGCEAAASLASRGVSTTLVAPQKFPQQHRLGEDVGRRLRALVEATGARFVGGVRVQSVADGTVVLDNGVSIETDLVLAAIGVAPNSDIAASAGLTVTDSRIVVDSDMATAAPGIFAAGDVALAFNPSAGRHIAVEHWQDAADHGAVAGARAAGADARWDAVPGFWTTIGESTVKYHAWGDGYDRHRIIDHDAGFTAWYERDGVAVGVLTHNADEAYDNGEKLIAGAEPVPVPMD